MLRIVVVGPSQPVYVEADAAEAITPGHVVKQNAAAKAIKNTLADIPDTPILVACENDLFGGDIDTPYAVNDRVLYQHLRSGCEFMGLVAAAGVAIAYDDYIALDAAGGVKKGTAATAIGRARTAVDNSAGGTPARVRVLVS
jgi:hypothetical protein